MRVLGVLLGCVVAVVVAVLLLQKLDRGQGPRLDISETEALELHECIASLRQSIQDLAQIMARHVEATGSAEQRREVLPPISAPELRDLVEQSLTQALERVVRDRPEADAEAVSLRSLYEDRIGEPPIAMSTLGTVGAARDALLLMDYSAVLRKLGVPTTINGSQDVVWEYEGGWVRFVDGRVSNVHMAE